MAKSKMTNKDKLHRMREAVFKQQKQTAMESLSACATRSSNKFVFAYSKLMVRQIWKIMAESLPRDQRDQKRKYVFLTERGNVCHRSPVSLGITPEAAKADPNITKVYFTTVKFASQPVEVLLSDAKKKRVTFGYLDVVYTPEGFEIFATRKQSGKRQRLKKPLVSSQDIDSLRPDALALGPLFGRLCTMIEAKTNG